MGRPPSRRGVRHRLIWGAGLVTLACIAAFAAGTLRAARYRAAARDREHQATRALWEARNIGAGRWAPNALGRAERAAREALIVMRTNDVRLTILGDFSAEAFAWSSARDAARDAARQAVANERAAQGRSTTAIAEAQRAVSRALEASALVHLRRSARKDLSRAELALIESRELRARHQYESARQRAEWAAGVADRVHDETLGVAARFLQANQVTTWRRWKTQLVAWSRSNRQPALLIEKADHRLTLYLHGEPVRSYDVDLGSNWVSAKAYAGDAATPEGQYHIIAKKDGRDTAFHRALLLNYPNDRDRRAFAMARRKGVVPAGARMGGLIEIHGAGGRGEDWTRGCIALSNADMDDLFRRVRLATPVTIVGGNGRTLYERLASRAADRPLPVYDQ